MPSCPLCKSHGLLRWAAAPRPPHPRGGLSWFWPCRELLFSRVFQDELAFLAAPRTKVLGRREESDRRYPRGCGQRAARHQLVLGVTGYSACGPGPCGHEFKNAKADGSELEGSLSATPCDNVQGTWGGSSAAIPAPTRRGQATSSIPANKEWWLLVTGLHGQLLGSGPSSGSVSGVSGLGRLCSDPAPCSVEPASLASASLVSPEPGRADTSSGQGGAGPPGENTVELRGCRNAWPPAKGTASVSRSDGPVRAAAGPGSAGGCRAEGRCRQEASKCLRIWVGKRGNP